MKKVGKTTITFRHDLNQIPYDYTVEVTNRFKALVRSDRMPEELWMEVCNTVQEAVIKTIPKGAVLRWQRNRTGRPLSPPQNHQKNI